MKHGIRTLCLTTAKPFNDISFEVLDFLFKQNHVEPLRVILWKKNKLNQEIYIGEIEVVAEDFETLKEVDKVYEKQVKESRMVTKDFVARTSKGQETSIGKIAFNMITLSQMLAPDS